MMYRFEKTPSQDDRAITSSRPQRTRYHWLAAALLCSLFAAPAMADTAQDPLASLIRGEAVPAVPATADPAPVPDHRDITEVYSTLQQQWLALGDAIGQVLATGQTSLSHAAGIEALYPRLQAADLLYRNRLQQWHDNPDLPPVARERIARTLDEYLQQTTPWHTLISTWLSRSDAAIEPSLNGFWHWLTDFQDRGELAALQQALANVETLSRRQPLLGNQSLPYSQTSLALPLTAASTGITPVYARQTEIDVSEADTASDDLTTLSDAVLAQAAALDYDSVSIFNFVQQSVRVQWYTGVMKGADNTLIQQAGNDADAAVLLSALLRASSIPTRYIQGVVRIPADTLARATGIQDPARQLRLLQRHGRAVAPVIEQGAIGAFDMEYVWVTAYLPYGNYRGTLVDRSGHAWVPLMPAGNLAPVPLAENYLADAGLDIAQLKTLWQTGAPSTSLVDYIAERVLNALPEEQADALQHTFSGVLPVPEVSALLPASLPFQVTAVSAESATLPETLRHRVRITLETEDAVPARLMQAELYLSQLDNQRFTLSWMPATTDVQETVNRFGGLGATPGWLVSMRPQLRLNGERVAVGEGALDMGAWHRMRVDLVAPYGERSLQRSWMAGGYYALSLMAQQGVEVADYSVRQPGDTEYSGARLLSQVAQRYNRQWYADEQRLATLAGLHLAHPWPALAVAANGYRREYVLDQLQALRWENITLDAMSHVTEPVDGLSQGAAATLDWLDASALHGAWLESDIFRSTLQVAAISADKGFAQAAQAGIAVRTLTPGQTLDGLTHPAHVLEDVQHWLDQGMAVSLPETEISFEEWHGSVWYVQDSVTGSRGYFISGGLAGGATASSDWSVDAYRRALTQIYTDPSPADEPIGFIRKVGNGDWQVGRPGEAGQPLAVQVLDTFGRPKADTVVNFTVVHGDAMLSAETAVTDLNGIAMVDVTHGFSTEQGIINFTMLNPGDEYPTQVASSLVDVMAVGPDGSFARMPGSFRLLLGPGTPAENSIVTPPPDLHSVDIYRGGKLAGNFRIRVLDQYGNPVANSGVQGSYSSQPAGPFIDGGLFKTETCSGPSWRGCGQSSVSGRSGTMGNIAFAFARGEGSVGGSETVIISIAGLAPRVYDGISTKLVSEVANLSHSIRMSKTGEINDAVAPGKTLPYRKTVDVHWPEPVTQPTPVEWYPTIQEWLDDNNINMSPSDTLEMLPETEKLVPSEAGSIRFESGGATIASSYRGNGRFELTITGGMVPGRYPVMMRGSARFFLVAYQGFRPHEHILFYPNPNGRHPVESGYVSAIATETNRYVDVPINAEVGYIWVVEPTVLGFESNDLAVPNSIPLRAVGGGIYETSSGARVLTQMLPANYPADTHILSLRAGGQETSANAFSPLSGAVIQPGVPVNLSHSHQLVYKVGSYGVESQPVNVPFYTPIFAYPGDNKTFAARHSIDPINNWSCLEGQTLGFELTHSAEVTVWVNDDEVMAPTLLPAGYHEVQTGQQTGISDYRMMAVSTLSGHIEERTGQIIVTSEFNPLPVGHTVVEGVNLYNGSLNLQREDFTLPGRGPDIALTRFYSSGGGHSGSPFGLGWGHSLNGYVQSLGCGGWQVAGGPGGGGMFFEEGDAFRAGKGYHGTLRRNLDDDGVTFDFYTRDGTRYHYRAYPEFRVRNRWMLSYIEDTNGNRTSLEYDRTSSSPKLLSVTDSSGRFLTFEYDGQYAGDGVRYELVARINGPEGFNVSYEYDASGRLTKVTRDAGGDTPSPTEEYGYAESEEILDLYDYMQRNNLVRIKGPLGYETSYVYQQLPFSGEVSNFAVGQISKATEQNGNVSMSFDYSDRRQAGDVSTQLTNFRGANVQYSLRGDGLILSQSLPQVDYAWDTDTLLLKSRTTQSSAGPIEVSYEYDAYGNRTSETLGSYTREWSYAPPSSFGDRPIKNRVASEKDRNGNETAYSYDRSGNLTSVEYPDGSKDEYSYTNNGDRKGHTDRAGFSINYRYDKHGYVAGEKTSDCCDVGRTWNDLGYLLSEEDGAGNATEYSYDLLGNRLSADYANGDSESFAYDAGGNRTRHTNRNGVEIKWDYDESGRRVAEHYPEVSRTWAYDAHGNLVSETDFRETETTHEWNDRDHRTKTTVSDRTVTYEVDEQGWVLEEDRGEGRVTAWTYDERGLPEQEEDAEGNVTAYRYDGQGNLTGITDRRGNETTLSYDAMHRLIKREEPADRTLSWQYDPRGYVTVETDANGNSIERAWSQHGQPVSEEWLDTDGKPMASQRFEYDGAGNRTQQTNGRGATTRFEYDEANRLEKLIRPDPLGPISYRRDGLGNVLEETHPLGKTLTREWDDQGRLVKEEDTLGALRAYTYDGNGNLLEEEDGEGTRIVREYNLYNELTKEERPVQAEGEFIITYGYDSVGNRITRSVTDNAAGQGGEWSYDYDLLNRRVSETDPAGDSTSTEYDEEGNPVRLEDANGNETTQTFDALNRLTKISDDLGTVKELAYDPHGNLLSEIDARGITTVYTYDALHRRTGIQRDGTQVQTLEYDQAGNLVAQEDANGQRTTWQYNDADRVTQETGLAAAVVRYDYDARGNRTRRLDGEGVSTTWAYDTRDRAITETLANTYTTAYTYDGNGNRLTMQRPGGGQWHYTYTPANQLATVSDPESGSSSYRYDGQGNRVQHTDGLGNITQWDYDVLGRLKAIVYPGSVRHSYLEYDGNGNLLSERTPNGGLISHEYDARNRRTETTYAGADQTPAAVEQFSYDGNNNLLSVQEQSGGGTPVTSEYGYDTFDRLTRYQSPFGETVTYSYDANGNRTRLVSSGGHASRYTYDPRNRLRSVSNRDGETTYSWRRNDQLSRISYSHGGSSRYEYDGTNRLTGLTHQAFGGEVARYIYEYDPNGNRTRQVEENGQGEQVTTYTYDSADRLTGVTYPDQSASYSYDAAWNRISETLRDLLNDVLTSDKTLGYNSRNQLTSVQDSQHPALNATYSYDANGNQTGKTQGGSTTDYAFDARNHLRSITTDGSPVGSFLYDYRGLRIQKQAPDITRYTHDDQAVLFQSDASGSVTHRFEYGPDRLLSLKPATQASEFYLLDALNSPIALVRGDGTLTARYSYDAWGNKRQDTGTSSNPFGFTGHEHDDETGLIYAKARYYDPETARFLSQDPWAGDAQMPPSLNKYLYAYQNPTVYVDPDGRAPITSDLRDALQTLAADQRRHTRTMNQQMGGSFLDDLGRRMTNTFTSIGGGLLEAAGAGVNMVDLALDTALTVHPLTRDTAVGRTSSERIANTRDTVQATASAATRATREAVAEHGVLGAGGRLASSAGDAASTFMGDVFVRGDLEAAGAFQSGLFSAALPGAGYARATRGVPQGGTRQVTIAESHAGPAVASNKVDDMARAVTRDQSWFDNVALNATRSPESSRLVLGHFAREGTSYQKVAAHYEGSYFKVDDWNSVTKGLSNDEIWRINETFLDQQVMQGKQILFSHNPLEARPNSFFEREVNYLQDLGYRFKQKNQWTWEAVYEPK
jgi:RHS repeat-associated protein